MIGASLFFARHHRPDGSTSVTGPLTLWGNFVQACTPQSDLPLFAVLFGFAAALCCLGVFVPALFTATARFLPDDAVRPAMVAVGLVSVPVALVAYVVMTFSQTGLGFGGAFALAKPTIVLKLIPIFQLACGAGFALGALRPFFPFASRALLGRP